MVYCAAKESHNECTRNTLKDSSCLRKWQETLKGSIFGVTPIPGPRVLGGGSVVAPTEEASQFDSKQCHEQFITLLSCFP